MNKIKNFFINHKQGTISVMILLFISICIRIGTFTDKETELDLQTYTCEVYMKDVKSAFYVAEAELIKEVDKYIKTVAPTSGVNACIFVEKCTQYDFDIKLALAQAHKESHFGTKGVAAKTNSIFNIGAYDGLSAEQLLEKRRGYRHPDFSIEPYIKKVISNYLVDGKTEQDLLIKYINKDGKRYASAPNYEIDLLKIYNNIDSIADITEKYLNYHRYKLLMDN